MSHIPLDITQNFNEIGNINNKYVRRCNIYNSPLYILFQNFNAPIKNGLFEQLLEYLNVYVTPETVFRFCLQASVFISIYTQQIRRTRGVISSSECNHIKVQYSRRKTILLIASIFANMSVSMDLMIFVFSIEFLAMETKKFHLPINSIHISM